jgi:methionyl-tRNA formyltransferase
VIRIYTKEKHISKIHNFLNKNNIKHEIYTTADNPELISFDLGISYCYPKKIIEPVLSTPKRGFINFHPGPLPKYKGPNEYSDAIKNKEVNWGVTAHYMTENYDDGKIIKIKNFKLHEPPESISELGAISHYFLFQLFKETINEIYH